MGRTHPAAAHGLDTWYRSRLRRRESSWSAADSYHSMRSTICHVQHHSFSDGMLAMQGRCFPEASEASTNMLPRHTSHMGRPQQRYGPFHCLRSGLCELCACAHRARAPARLGDQGRAALFSFPPAIPCSILSFSIHHTSHLPACLACVCSGVTALPLTRLSRVWFRHVSSIVDPYWVSSIAEPAVR